MKYSISELNELLDKLDSLTLGWVPESCRQSVTEDVANLHGEIQELFYKVSEGE